MFFNKHSNERRRNICRVEMKPVQLEEAAAEEDKEEGSAAVEWVVLSPPDRVGSVSAQIVKRLFLMFPDSLAVRWSVPIAERR